MFATRSQTLLTIVMLRWQHFVNIFTGDHFHMICHQQEGTLFLVDSSLTLQSKCYLDLVNFNSLSRNIFYYI